MPCEESRFAKTLSSDDWCIESHRQCGCSGEAVRGFGHPVTRIAISVLDRAGGHVSLLASFDKLAVGTEVQVY